MPPLAQPWRAALAASILAVLLPLGVAHAQEVVSAEKTEDVAARVAKLEAEIAALKIMVGSLETVVRARPSLPPDGERAAREPPGPEDLKARLSALEVQIGALTNQIEKFAAKLEKPPAPETAAAAEEKASQPAPAAPEPKPAPKTDAPKTAAPAEEKASAPQAAALDPEPRPRPEETPTPKISTPNVSVPERKPREVVDAPSEPEEADVPVPPALAPVVPPEANHADPSKPRWYGLKPDEDGGAVGSLPDNASAKNPQPVYPSKEAQQLYEQGYGDYLRRDYGSAEKEFRKLVAAYPNDPLAGSAQYWVGETQYVRKRYQGAADSFLAGYRKYSGSDKAPDTLLRLGMSLAALGRKTAACSTFKELGKKFPGAPGHVHSQAKSAAGKAGC